MIESAFLRGLKWAGQLTESSVGGLETVLNVTASKVPDCM
jgi:hypothetical protein